MVLLVQLGGEWVIAGVLSGGTSFNSTYGDISWWTGTAIYRDDIEARGGEFGIPAPGACCFANGSCVLSSMMNAILPVGLLKVQTPHAHHHHALPLRSALVALALNALNSPLQVAKMVVGFSTVSDLPALTMCVPPVHAA